MSTLQQLTIHVAFCFGGHTNRDILHSTIGFTRLLDYEPQFINTRTFIPMNL